MDFEKYGLYATGVEFFMGHMAELGTMTALDADPRARVNGLPAKTAIHFEPAAPPDTPDPTLYIYGHNSGLWHEIDPLAAMLEVNGMAVAKICNHQFESPPIPAWEEQFRVPTLFGAPIQSVTS